VLNLIFALFCGCLSAGWAASWVMLDEEPDQYATAVETWMRQVVEPSLEKQAGVEDSAFVRAIAEESAKPETVKALIVAAGGTSATPVIRTATMAAGLAQAALFVGSILLLMRKNTGRVLSMLALLVFIGATITTWVKFEVPADRIAAELKSRVVASPGYHALSSQDREEADRLLEISPEIFKGGVGSTSAFVIAWPVISLLILFGSRSIREACTPTYGGPGPTRPY
jgi:hypothetical protein